MLRSPWAKALGAALLLLVAFAIQLGASAPQARAPPVAFRRVAAIDAHSEPAEGLPFWGMASAVCLVGGLALVAALSAMTTHRAKKARRDDPLLKEKNLTERAKKLLTAQGGDDAGFTFDRFEEGNRDKWYNGNVFATTRDGREASVSVPNLKKGKLPAVRVGGKYIDPKTIEERPWMLTEDFTERAEELFNLKGGEEAELTFVRFEEGKHNKWMDGTIYALTSNGQEVHVTAAMLEKGFLPFVHGSANRRDTRAEKKASAIQRIATAAAKLGMTAWLKEDQDLTVLQRDFRVEYRCPDCPATTPAISVSFETFEKWAAAAAAADAAGPSTSTDAAGPSTSTDDAGPSTSTDDAGPSTSTDDAGPSTSTASDTTTAPAADAGAAADTEAGAAYRDCCNQHAQKRTWLGSLTRKGFTNPTIADADMGKHKNCNGYMAWADAYSRASVDCQGSTRTGGKCSSGPGGAVGRVVGLLISTLLYHCPLARCKRCKFGQIIVGGFQHVVESALEAATVFNYAKRGVDISKYHALPNVKLAVGRPSGRPYQPDGVVGSVPADMTATGSNQVVITKDNVAHYKAAWGLGNVRDSMQALIHAINDTKAPMTVIVTPGLVSLMLAIQALGLTFVIILYMAGPNSPPIYIDNVEDLKKHIVACRRKLDNIVPAPMYWDGRGEPEIARDFEKARKTNRLTRGSLSDALKLELAEALEMEDALES